MSGLKRRYRARIADRGSTEVEGNVAHTLDVSDHLTGAPVIQGHKVDPLRGRTSRRPSTITAIASDALLGELAGSERWHALGRLVDVQVSDDGGTSWETIGTGRISDMGEPDGQGRLRIEVSDESWKVSRARVFRGQNTTQLFPHGPKYRWRGHEAVAGHARLQGFQAGGQAATVSLDGSGVVGGTVMPALERFLEEDRVEDPGLFQGNFRHLRLHWQGQDWEVRSVSGARAGTTILGVVVHFGTDDPPADDPGPAYLHAPGAGPSLECPLHIGAKGEGDWGTDDGWIGPIELVRRIWDEVGVRYDADTLDALEDDDSIPLIAPRVEGEPDDLEQWIQDEILGPLLLVALRDAEGRRTIVDLRQPRDLDPSSLPTWDAANAAHESWKLHGREAVNQVHAVVANYWRPDAPEGVAIAPPDDFEPHERTGGDGLFRDDHETDPVEGNPDAIQDAGEQDHELDLRALLGPGSVDDAIRRAIDEDDGPDAREFADVTGHAILDVWGEGPVRGQIEVSRTEAEATDEGDLRLIDCASLGVANPNTGERSGKMLVRVLSVERHPAHGLVEWLHIGADNPSLPEPILSVQVDPDDDSVVEVTVTNVPAGARAVVLATYRQTDDALIRGWARRKDDIQDNETVRIGGSPGEGYIHLRAWNAAPHRIRSDTTAEVHALDQVARAYDLEVTLDDGGVPTIQGSTGAHTEGVRISTDIHRAEDGGDPGDPQDHEASDLEEGITLDVTVPMGWAVSVEVEPWDGWDDQNGEVTGDAGTTREKTRERPRPTNVPWGSLTARREGDTVFFEGDGNHLSESFSWGIALVSGPGELPTDPDDPSLEASGHEDSALAEVSVGGIEPGEGEQVWVLAWFHPDADGEEPPGPRAAARARVEDAELPGNTVTSLVPRWDPAPGGAHLAILGERGQETRSVRVEYDYASTPGGALDTSVDYTLDLGAGGGTFTHAVEDETGAIKFWDPAEDAPQITLTPHTEEDGGGTAGTSKVVEPDDPGETGTTGGRVAPSDDPSAIRQGGAVLFQSAASLGFAVTADGQGRPLVQLTGTATPAQGGTGTDAVPLEGALLRGDDQGAYTLLSPGSEGQVLKMGAEVPDWAEEEVGAPDPHGNEAHDPSFAEEGHTHDAADVDDGVFHPDRVALSAAGDLLFAQDAGALNRLAIGSQGQVLTVDGTGMPSWQDPANGNGLPDATEEDRWLRSTGSEWVESDWSLPGAGAPNSELHFLGTRSGGDAEWVSLQESDLPSHGHVWGDLSGYPDVNAGSGLSGGGTISGDVTLSLDTPIAAGDGGTGITDLVGSGRLLHSVDASTWSLLSPGSQGQVLTMAGTGLPEWQDAPVGDPNAFSGTRTWIDSENEEQHDVTVDDGLIQSWSVGPAPI